MVSESDEAINGVSIQSIGLFDSEVTGGEIDDNYLQNSHVMLNESG